MEVRLRVSRACFDAAQRVRIGEEKVGLWLRIVEDIKGRLRQDVTHPYCRIFPQAGTSAAIHEECLLEEWMFEEGHWHDSASGSLA